MHHVYMSDLVFIMVYRFLLVVVSIRCNLILMQCQLYINNVCMVPFGTLLMELICLLIRFSCVQVIQAAAMQLALTLNSQPNVEICTLPAGYRSWLVNEISQGLVYPCCRFCIFCSWCLPALIQLYFPLQSIYICSQGN